MVLVIQSLHHRYFVVSPPTRKRYHLPFENVPPVSTFTHLNTFFSPVPPPLNILYRLPLERLARITAFGLIHGAIYPLLHSLGYDSNSNTTSTSHL